MTHFELESLWVEKRLKVKFEFDDFVEVLSGERAGEVGRVVSLLTLEPEPGYVVELPDETNENVSETSLKTAKRPTNAGVSKLILKQL